MAVSRLVGGRQDVVGGEHGRGGPLAERVAGLSDGLLRLFPVGLALVHRSR